MGIVRACRVWLVVVLLLLGAAPAQAVTCGTNADCADTNFCTTNERCVGGFCVVDAVDCDDGNLVKGKGADLPLPVLPLTTKVTVQLKNDGGSCWEAGYSAATKNQADQSKAKAD